MKSIKVHLPALWSQCFLAVQPSYTRGDSSADRIVVSSIAMARVIIRLPLTVNGTLPYAVASAPDTEAMPQLGTSNITAISIRQEVALRMRDNVLDKGRGVCQIRRSSLTAGFSAAWPCEVFVVLGDTSGKNASELILFSRRSTVIGQL